MRRRRAVAMKSAVPLGELGLVEHERYRGVQLTAEGLIEGAVGPLLGEALKKGVLAGADDDLVIDVGDIAHVRYAITAGTQITRDHVEKHHHARMAQMTVVVYRHATDIHPHMIRVDGCE